MIREGTGMSRGFKIALIVLSVLAVAIICYYPFSPGGRQMINMRVAAKHLPEVQAIIAADPRYKDVQAAVYTGQDGALHVAGDVQREEDVCDLMRAVSDKHLPIAVRFDLTVRALRGPG